MTRTTIPINENLLQPKVIDNVKERLSDLRNRQKVYADRTAKPSKELQIGDNVQMQVAKNEWHGSKIKETTDKSRSYIVETKKGTYRRNTAHIKVTKANIEEQKDIISGTNKENQDKDERNEMKSNHTTTTVTEKENAIIPFSSSPLATVKSSPSTSRPPLITTRSGRTIKPIQKLDL